MTTVCMVSILKIHLLSNVTLGIIRLRTRMVDVSIPAFPFHYIQVLCVHAVTCGGFIMFSL